MSAPAVSPGAALLRRSRMFSIPAAIPTPPGDWSTATKHHSETATKHFPTRLSVTTTRASRVNGDFGFKRSFPAKTTSSQTQPLIRVNQVDSVEQVTDFNSASDHTLTLRKFQEMNMPITVPPAGMHDIYERYMYPVSVFEEDSDKTAFDADEALQTENTRWRFNGPWLAGMGDGEFEKYLNSEVRDKRVEFKAYLRDHMAKEMTAQKKKEALEAGSDAKSIPEITAESITEEVYSENLRRLRADRIELYRVVSRFLDLAPVSIEAETDNMSAMAHNVSREFRQTGPYSTHGPPITHPSAGLSYLRTRAFEDNHPLYGPQAYHAPVKSRVLFPRSSAFGAFKPSIGTGGLVAHTPSGDASINQRQGEHRALYEFDLTTPGGGKKYYALRSATIDSSGRINLAVEDSVPATTMVAKERAGEADVWNDAKNNKNGGEVDLNPRAGPRSTGNVHRAFGDGQSYGLSRDRGL